jgi:pSer/pThr/pTyr-binding forkhead associated (FHA) protein
MADATRACPKCGAAVPASFLFCGRCGAKIGTSGAAPAEALGQTQFFGQLQAVGKAKLVLIKGEGMDGISYQLNATEHVAGRSQGVILFPDDRFLSARHANFFYRDGKLWLRDEGSTNGVFLRIRQPVQLQDSDLFLVGEELLRFETIPPPRPAELVAEDGTVFYGTPLREGIGCRIVQILLGGRMGMVYVPTKPQVLIGREACDMNFPRDRFISGRHARLEQQGRSFLLSDMGSKNGTYLRLRQERELSHGDYVFIGQQLFRVEITAF